MEPTIVSTGFIPSLVQISELEMRTIAWIQAPIQTSKGPVLFKTGFRSPTAITRIEMVLVPNHETNSIKTRQGLFPSSGSPQPPTEVVTNSTEFSRSIVDVSPLAEEVFSLMKRGLIHQVGSIHLIETGNHRFGRGDRLRLQTCHKTNAKQQSQREPLTHDMNSLH